MEVAIAHKSNIKVKGKAATIVVDPQNVGSKIPADAVILLTLEKADLAKVEGARLVIKGSGEYEISGVKITGFRLNNHMVYELRIDGVLLLIADSLALTKVSEDAKEYNMVVVHASSAVDLSEIAKLAPAALLYYGEKTSEFVKPTAESEIKTSSKYVTIVDKLPHEMETVILQ